LWIFSIAKCSNGKRFVDLRHRCYGVKGVRIVRLTIHVPDEQVLLSDEMDWHCALNDGFITDSEAESDLCDEREKTWPQEQYEAAKRLSWEKMFYLEREHDPAWGKQAPHSMCRRASGCLRRIW
jgi:hypothetical protein